MIHPGYFVETALFTVIAIVSAFFVAQQLYRTWSAPFVLLFLSFFLTPRLSFLFLFIF